MCSKIRDQLSTKGREVIMQKLQERERLREKFKEQFGQYPSTSAGFLVGGFRAEELVREAQETGKPDPLLLDVGPQEEGQKIMEQISGINN